MCARIRVCVCACVCVHLNALPCVFVCLCGPFSKRFERILCQSKAERKGMESRRKSKGEHDRHTRSLMSRRRDSHRLQGRPRDPTGTARRAPPTVLHAYVCGRLGLGDGWDRLKLFRGTGSMVMHEGKKGLNTTDTKQQQW